MKIECFQDLIRPAFSCKELLDFNLPDFESFCMKLEGKFQAKRDSLLYSLMLRKAVEEIRIIRKDKREIKLFDLGSGSSLPTLYLLEKLDFERNISISGIEIDSEVIRESKSNSGKLNLNKIFNFYELDINSFLTTLELSQNLPCIVGSNPPYVPCPKEADSNLLPINGGQKGDTFVKKLLASNFHEDSLIVLQWSSLTNPHKTLRYINENFEIVKAFSIAVPFGKYTSDPRVYHYLDELRKEGECLFEGTKAESSSYVIVSTLLRLKKSKNA